MSETDQPDWPEANQRYLMAALGMVRYALDSYIADVGEETPPEGSEPQMQELEDAAATLPSTSALQDLCEAFGLSSFERDLLLLCAGAELDASFGQVCAQAQGDSQRTYPTFGIALAAFPSAHWDALVPSAILRKWRMIELVRNGSEGFVDTRLRIDERILHYLTGISYLDERLQGLIQPLPPCDELVPSQEEIVEQVKTSLAQHGSRQPPPVINLCGSSRANKAGVAVRAYLELGIRALELKTTSLPQSASELDALARLWYREAILSHSGLVFRMDGDENDSRSRDFLSSIDGLVVVTSLEPIGECEREIIRMNVGTPNAAEQRGLWRLAFGPAVAEGLNGHLDRLVTHFDMNQRAIESAYLQLEESDLQLPQQDLNRRLWSVCRSQARQGLSDLARHIEPSADWGDIVLPEAQMGTLREIANQVKHRSKVYETWGFARKSPRGLGIAALFTGPSGTGKTMASEVLANELNLDLYHVDLSQVVSKYIGETEKNLGRVFDAAEEGGAVLLFDEADALFGKRSEVKDSHDRYANIEVSYLLQRMEAYRGLAILTTNQKSAIDDAFQRRIRFLVNFPFPDASQRAEIWRRIFPHETPVDELDIAKLSRLNVAGGIIRNIALQAAFLAAESDTSVGMSELRRSTRSVYARLEKSLSDNDTRGWV